MNDKSNKKNKRIRKNYARTLEELADEFKFSNAVLYSDKEIDDRHIISNLDSLNDDEEKIYKDKKASFILLAFYLI